MPDTLSAACDYIARGWSPIPIPHRAKGPLIDAWQDLRITAETAPAYFNGAPQNVGVILGKASGGLTDLDLDCPEAIAAAPYILPKTAVFGHASKPASHWIYRTNLCETQDRAAIKFMGSDKTGLLETRMGGGGLAAQTVFPPSTHKETGEPIQWVDLGGPGNIISIAGDELIQRARRLAAASELARNYPKVGGRHDAALVLGGFLARCGWSEAQAGVFVEAVAVASGQPKDKRDDVKRTARSGASADKRAGFPKLAETFGKDVAKKVADWLGYTGEQQLDAGETALEGEDGKPIIKLGGGILDRIATQGEEALRSAGVPLFQRANELVRPIISEVDAAHGRRTRVAQLLRVDSVYLRDLLCRVATWTKWDGRSKKWVATNAPAEVAATILARAGEWSFSALAGVISTPTMRPDGTILSKEGYDEATRLLLVAPPEMPAIPDAPSRDDALAALALLKGLLVEFPFVGDLDRAIALSALITPVVRGAFPVAPMHSAKAPSAGSGKSYLFDIVAAIAIGQIMPVMAAGANEEELEKRLGAALIAGQPLICIDNVDGELGGDALCQTIERPLVQIRILGRSERVTIEARATTTFCTGNNIVIVGDLTRRVVTINLDPKMELPETREFKGNPLSLVLANRGAYVAAALIICRAYVVAGKPAKAKRLASFEGWSDIVRSALIWLGEKDIVNSIEAARSEDPERADLKEMLSAWADVLGGGYRRRLSLAEVIRIIGEQVMGEASWPRLSAAIHAVAARGKEPADAKRLGFWLRSRKGRVVGRLRFMNDADQNKVQVQWWVDDLSGETTVGRRQGKEDADE